MGNVECCNDRDQAPKPKIARPDTAIDDDDDSGDDSGADDREMEAELERQAKAEEEERKSGRDAAETTETGGDGGGQAATEHPSPAGLDVKKTEAVTAQIGEDHEEGMDTAQIAEGADIYVLFHAANGMGSLCRYGWKPALRKLTNTTRDHGQFFVNDVVTHKSRGQGQVVDKDEILKRHPELDPNHPQIGEGTPKSKKPVAMQ